MRLENWVWRRGEEGVWRSSVSLFASLACSASMFAGNVCWCWGWDDGISWRRRSLWCTGYGTREEREAAVGSLLQSWYKYLGVVYGKQKERCGHNICPLVSLAGAVLRLAKSVCWCLGLGKTTSYGREVRRGRYVGSTGDRSMEYRTRILREGPITFPFTLSLEMQ